MQPRLYGRHPGAMATGDELVLVGIIDTLIDYGPFKVL
jgi:hypothetical protein